VDKISVIKFDAHLTAPFDFFFLQGMQGAMNQMGTPMPQGPYVGMNQMHSGSLPTSGGPPLGGFPGNLPNMQGPSNANYPQGASFNRPQGGQMPLMQGYSPYQVR